MSPKRYESDLEDDGKSGYRQIRLSDPQLENHLINLLVIRGGQPAAKLIGWTGESSARVYLALGRLHERGAVHVDSFLSVTYCPPKRLPWWRTFGSIHPAYVLIACLLLTTGGCAAWIASVRAQHADSSTR